MYHIEINPVKNYDGTYTIGAHTNRSLTYLVDRELNRHGSDFTATIYVESADEKQLREHYSGDDRVTIKAV